MNINQNITVGIVAINVISRNSYMYHHFNFISIFNQRTFWQRAIFDSSVRLIYDPGDICYTLWWVFLSHFNVKLLDLERNIFFLTLTFFIKGELKWLYKWSCRSITYVVYTKYCFYRLKHIVASNCNYW